MATHKKKAKKKMAKRKAAKKTSAKRALHDGSDRPSMGTGIAEIGATTLSRQYNESEARMANVRKEMGLPPIKRAKKKN